MKSYKTIKNDRVSNRLFIFLIIPLLVMIVSLACNLNTALSTTSTTIKESPTPDKPFLDITVAPHDDTKVTLLSVDVDSTAKINEIIVLLPDRLKDASIIANNIPLQAQLDEEGSLLLPLDQAASEVSLEFQTGNEKATCTIKANDLQNPQGDCAW